MLKWALSLAPQVLPAQPTQTSALDMGSTILGITALARQALRGMPPQLEIASGTDGRANGCA
jgi:hypothetical protein